MSTKKMERKFMRKSEMSRMRTIQKQEEYFNKTMEVISSSKRKVSNARLRKGLYKKFFEEFYVLLKYTKLKYGIVSNVKFRWVDIHGQILNYDGEIYVDNKLTEKVEVTCPLISKKDKDNAKELNEKGYTELEVGNLKEALDMVKTKIIDKTIDKNQNKNYDHSITLVVYLNDDIHFWKTVDICNKTLIEMKEVLKKEIYQFKNVYILESINNKYNLEKIK